MSGKVYVTEQYLSDIADAIRAKNGASTLYHPSEMAAAIDAISGGASNFVTGTFTTGSTTGTTGTLDVPYTGAGYPLALVIVVEGGMYNSAVTPWYSAVSRYAVGQFVATKANTTTAPSYGTSGAANQGSVQVMYKSSTSSATSYSSTRSATLTPIQARTRTARRRPPSAGGATRG